MASRTSEALAHQPGRGREARAPVAIPPEGWKDVLWRVHGAIGEDRVFLTAAGVTYYLLLSLVPTLSAIVSIYGLFSSRASILDHVDMLSGLVPADALALIRDQLTRLASEGTGTLGWTLLFSLALALWSSSAGVKAMFDAMNVAYGETEKRNFFHLSLLALAFTLAGAVAALLVAAIVVVMPVALQLVWLGGGTEWLVRVAAYLLMAVIVACGLAALYRWGPSRQQARWRWISPGTALALVLTIAVSVLFSWYVANFGNYNATYGSLGALIGLVTWVWLTVSVIIIGGELNAETEHQTARDSTIGPELPLGQRGAQMADSVGDSHPGAGGDAGVRALGRRQRPISWGTLALAVPAAIVLRAALRRRRR